MQVDALPDATSTFPLREVATRRAERTNVGHGRLLIITLVIAVLSGAFGGTIRSAEAGWLALYEGAGGTAAAVHGVSIGDLLRAPEGGYLAFAGAGRSEEGASAPRQSAFRPASAQAAR